MAKHKSLAVGIPVGSDQRWQAEDDLRTLQNACMIRKDPKRLKAVQALAREKLVEMGKILGEGETGEG